MFYENNKKGWIRYYAEERRKARLKTPGKWMLFVRDQDTANEICKAAIAEGVCKSAKCRDFSFLKEGEEGLVCLYINGDEPTEHRKVIEFMLHHNFVPRTRSGMLYNLAFKFDHQTHALEYGSSFKAKFTLSSFIDLVTGEFLD